MGFYDNYSDPPPSNPSFSGSWDHAGPANVQSYDSASVQQAKVENYRRANGMNPLTGLYDPVAPVNAGSGYAGASGDRQSAQGRQSGDHPSSGNFFKYAFLFLIAVPGVVYGLYSAAMWYGYHYDAPTMALRLATSSFSGYPLARPDRYLPPKTAATPVDPAKLAHLIRPYINETPAATKLRWKKVSEISYLCMLQRGCKQALTAINEEDGSNLSLYAASFLSEKIKAGDEHAAQDLCMLTIMTGTSHRDVLDAPRLCSRSVEFNPALKSSKKVMAEIENSFSVTLAQMYRRMDPDYPVFR